MAPTNRAQSRPLMLRGAADSILAPEELAGRIHNLVPSDDGTLRSVVGPAEYCPAEYADISSETFGTSPYVEPGLGIHHTLLGDRQRDILLAHFNGYIWEHRGWDLQSGSFLGWRIILGNSPFAKYGYGLPESDDRPGFLTQFVSTPNGVVIVPQGGRSFFYDGEVVAPLGYAIRPGPPQGFGKGLTRVGANSWDYSGLALEGRANPPSFGPYRVGTITNMAVNAGSASGDSNPHGGVFNKFTRRAKVQWVDRWGNLSPASLPSEPVTLPKEDNLTKDRKLGSNTQEPVEALRKMPIWTSISEGPDVTVGRIVLLTQDLESSGVPWYYEAPSDTSTMTTAFATLPDNSQTLFMDNVPDGWLTQQETEVDPVPNFRLACMAFGRLWIGNWDGGEGAVRPSLPGRWGTFPVNSIIYPDPTGAQVTGMVKTPAGLIICTIEGTYLVEPNDEGDGFKARTLSSTSGCVSPNTMQVLPSGLAIWLGREGWYACDGESVQVISLDINQEVVRRINRGRWQRAVAAVDPRTGEYRCWVPIGASRKNNLCVVFDGESWRTRDDVDASAVCMTNDHRGLMLALGTVLCVDDQGSDTEHFSVWVLDHANTAAPQPKAREAVLETSWLRAQGSQQKGSPVSLQLWLRGTNANLQGTVDVARDWREHPLVHSRADVDMLAPDDQSVVWGTAVLGGNYSPSLRKREQIPYHWTRRRPYWYKVDTYVPDCEVFKVTLRVTGDLDVLGLLYEEIPSVKGGASKPSKR